MNKKTIVAIASILVVLGIGYAVAAVPANGFWNGMMGYVATTAAMAAMGMDME